MFAAVIWYYIVKSFKTENQESEMKNGILSLNYHN